MEKGSWDKATTYGEIALAGFRRYYGHRAGLVAALLVRLVTTYCYHALASNTFSSFRFLVLVYCPVMVSHISHTGTTSISVVIYILISVTQGWCSYVM